jgi:hypothetical protein
VHTYLGGGILEGNRPLGKPRRRWKDDIKMDLRGIRWSDMDWLHLAKDRDQCRATVKTEINFQVPQKFRNPSAAERLLDS